MTNQAKSSFCGSMCSGFSWLASVSFRLSALAVIVALLVTVHNMRMEIEGVTTQMIDAQDALSLAEQQKQAAITSTTGTIQEMNQLQTDLANSHGEVQKLQVQLSGQQVEAGKQLKQAQEEAGKQLKQAQQEAGTATQEAAQAAQLLQDKAAQLQQLEAKVQHLESGNSEQQQLQQQMEQLKGEKSQLHGQVSELQGELQLAKDQATEGDKLRQTYEVKAKEHEAKVEGLHQTIKQLEEKAKEDVNEQQKQVTVLDDKLKACVDEVKSVTLRLHEAFGKEQVALKQLQKVTEAKYACRGDHETCNKKITELQLTIDNMADVAKTVDSLVQQQKEEILQLQQDREQHSETEQHDLQQEKEYHQQQTEKWQEDKKILQAMLGQHVRHMKQVKEQHSETLQQEKTQHEEQFQTLQQEKEQLQQTLQQHQEHFQTLQQEKEQLQQHQEHSQMLQQEKQQLQQEVMQLQQHSNTLQQEKEQYHQHSQTMQQEIQVQEEAARIEKERYIAFIEELETDCDRRIDEDGAIIVKCEEKYNKCRKNWMKTDKLYMQMKERQRLAGSKDVKPVAAEEVEWAVEQVEIDGLI